MAVYTPVNLIGPSAALTATPTTYVSAAATVAIIRTILATATAGSITLTVALGADAAGTRVIAATPLTANVPYVLNAWLITAAGSAHAIDVTSNATGTVCLANISGYTYG